MSVHFESVAALCASLQVLSKYELWFMDMLHGMLNWQAGNRSHKIHEQLLQAILVG